MNQLANESSPYLLQHASNPVDWHPWGDAAIQEAKDRDCPIFLSIGYSACHWCHVMEHESFASESIARQMNEGFVNIKVDREERPDLDQIYMNAVMAMTGRGGWPMSVFLTPDLKPFFCGTYWPPESRMGMPGFQQILSKIQHAWTERRSDIEESSTELTNAVIQLSGPRGEVGRPDESLLHVAMGDLLQAADGTYGGFGAAPKFPHSMDIRLLLRCWRRFNNSDALHVARLSCDRMAAGGIYDHLGGGFHRYSTDAHWLVPHFEKMLYDNALLLATYSDLYQITRHPEHLRVIQETCDYIRREMTLPNGSFCSTQDADSEGEEGRFFVWQQQQIQDALGDQQAKVFCAAYDVRQQGNWEGKSILNRPKPFSEVARDLGIDREELLRQLEPSKQKLFALRSQRVAPGTDDKVITAWNGMMISGLAMASRSTGQPEFRQLADQAADGLLSVIGNDDGRLMHSWRNGRTSGPAFLDDYCCLIDGLIELYQCTFDESRVAQAVQLADIVLADFADQQAQGFFYTSQASQTPIVRIKDSQDGATPSGNAMAATALLKLGLLTGQTSYLDAAEGTLSLLKGQLARAAMSGGQALIAIEHLTGPMPVVVIQSDSSVPEQSDMLNYLNGRFTPGVIIVWRGAEHRKSPTICNELLEPHFLSREPCPQKDRGWVCQQGTCLQPVDRVEDLSSQLDGLLPLPTL